MTEVDLDVVEPQDRFDRRLASGATGVLASFNAAGVLDAADVHVATRLVDLAGEDDEDVALALALTVRAVRAGSVCLDLTGVAGDTLVDGEVYDDLAALPWPDPAGWLDAVAGSRLLGDASGRVPPVLHLHEDGDGGRLLYLDRYWREEEQVCADLLARLPDGTPDASPDRPGSAAGDAGLDEALLRVFPAEGYGEQRAAARVALTQHTTVLTGGPGTGKTTTVAALLALLVERAERAGDTRPRIALAAPTGKAAARLQQAVHEEIDKLGADDRRRLAPLDLRAVTLHRLLGSRPDTAVRFRHHRENRLPQDVIVVDETSMVSLTMMARLLEAIRPETRLILVGDPDQLTSVEAGAVLADLVEGLGARTDVEVAALRTSHRFGESIRSLAAAVRAGDADGALDLLRDGGEHIELVGEEDPTPRLRELLVPHALRLRDAARDGDHRAALDALDEQRLLCAHREGPAGVSHWNRQVERWVGEETGAGIWSQWYAGRPLLVTANDYGLGLHNGDTGLTVRRPDGTLRAVMAGSAGPRDLAVSRLGDVETMHAMTIHKSQGSQARTVVVRLPPPESRLLTRELLYTALTRARERVVVVGDEAEVRAAVARRAVRATGLRGRLASGSA